MMKSRSIFALFVLLSLLWTCQKAPTEDQLLGTWFEQTDEVEKSKLIFFEGDSLYFFHGTSIDTLSYSLDSKHKTMYLTFIHHPTTGASNCQVTYHKKKEILTFVGLLPAQGSNPATTHYKH